MKTGIDYLAFTFPQLYGTHFARPRPQRRRLKKPRSNVPNQSRATDPAALPNRLQKRRPLSELNGLRLVTLQTRLDEQCDERRAQMHILQNDLHAERTENGRLADRLSRAELETVKERRNRLRLLSSYNQAIGRISIIEHDLGLFSSSEDVFVVSPTTRRSIPQRVDGLRSHIRRLAKELDATKSSNRALLVDLAEVKRSFVEREVVWWNSKQASKPPADNMTLLLQLEFGMIQWKRRGMELELAAAHRELDLAHGEIDRLCGTQVKLEESRRVVRELQSILGVEQARVKRLDSGLTIRAQFKSGELTELSPSEMGSDQMPDLSFKELDPTADSNRNSLATLAPTLSSSDVLLTPQKSDHVIVS